MVFSFDSVLAEGGAAYCRSGWGVFSFVGVLSLCHFVLGNKEMELQLNSSFADISIRAKSPTAGIKAEIVAIFILKPEAFMHRIISLVAKMATPGEAKFQVHYYRLASDLDQ